MTIDLLDLSSNDQSTWAEKWSAKATPWDTSTAHPALLNILAQSGTNGIPHIPTQGKALVPGCGRGYDVAVFAERGLECLGVDSSPEGVEQAREFLKSQNAPESARIEQADFFKLERPAGGYDLIYDYTFLCALPPPLRPLWSSTLTTLSSPTTLLITLQFPLSSHPNGPPYALSHEIYEELLGREWEKVYGRVVGKEESRGKEGEGGLLGFKEGREGIAVWRKRVVKERL